MQFFYLFARARVKVEMIFRTIACIPFILLVLSTSHCVIVIHIVNESIYYSLISLMFLQI